MMWQEHKIELYLGGAFDRFAWLPKSHSMRPSRGNNRRPPPRRVGRQGKSPGRRGGGLCVQMTSLRSWLGDFQRALVAQSILQPPRLSHLLLADVGYSFAGYAKWTGSKRLKIWGFFGGGYILNNWLCKNFSLTLACF